MDKSIDYKESPLGDVIFTIKFPSVENNISKNIENIINIINISEYFQ